MDVVTQDLFGGLLSLFICAMPLGLVVAIRRFEAQKAKAGEGPQGQGGAPTP